ncbi:MAG TPA: DUF4149 domain-containing protein [Gemmatimonadaceae bacterium]|nr:DUF4149 domain-containing protein [Gemmatimonadaceae bacterium]
MIRSGVGQPVAALVLGAWLGAAVFFAAIVAPATFRTVPDSAAAGALVRATLPAIFDAGAVAGLLVLWLGFGRRAAVICGAGITACCAVSQFVVARRIDQLRLHLATPIETLAPSDPSRLAFDHLHMASVGLLAAAMILAVLAIVWLTRSGLASAVSPE